MFLKSRTAANQSAALWHGIFSTSTQQVDRSPNCTSSSHFKFPDKRLKSNQHIPDYTPSPPPAGCTMIFHHNEHRTEITIIHISSKCKGPGAGHLSGECIQIQSNQKSGKLSRLKRKRKKQTLFSCSLSSIF